MKRIEASPQLLKILNQSYFGGKEGNKKVSRNYWLRNEQEKLLEELSAHYDETKVDVLRAIIDEWREMKMRSCNGQ